MASASRLGDGADDGSRMNVAIFPVQLIHDPEASGSRPAPLEVAPFPEADFEDCSSFVDLRLLRHGLVLNGVSQPNDYALDDSDSEDSITFVSMSEGKRKAASPVILASRKHRKDDFTLLTSTVCRFRVHSQLEEERASLRAIQRAESGCILSSISEVRVASRSNVADEDSWMKTALEAYDGDSNLVAILPVVDTDKIPFARQPHRFTNGKWLEAMVALCKGRIGETGAEAVKVDASLVRGVSLDAVGSEDDFVLELHLSVYISLDAFDPAASSSPPWLADHLHRLMRFCFPDDAAEQEMHSRGELTASSIYSLLPSTTLPPLEHLQPIDLNASLYPFQMRSVNFLLGREGKRAKHKTEDGEVILEDVEGVMAHDGVQKLGLWWQEVQARDGVIYYNPLFGKLTKRLKETQMNDISGGILSDEMGLGKTIVFLGGETRFPSPSRRPRRPRLAPARMGEEGRSRLAQARVGEEGRRAGGRSLIWHVWRLGREGRLAYRVKGQTVGSWQTDRQTGKRGRQTKRRERWAGRQTGRQADRQTDRAVSSMIRSQFIALQEQLPQSGDGQWRGERPAQLSRAHRSRRKCIAKRYRKPLDDSCSRQ